MSHAWPFIAVALLLDGLAGLTGGLLSDRRLFRHQAPLVGFAAGALVSAVFLDILPEALDSFGRAAFAWALASFAALAIVESALGDHRRVHAGSTPRTLPASLLASDALHNVGDGVAVAAAFLVSKRAGIATAIAVIAHEVPQEVGDYALLRRAGLPRARALLALTAVQLTAFLGALAVALLAGVVDRMTGAVLAIASGMFLYIGATDLLPEITTGRTPADRRARMLGFLGGAGLLAAASWLQDRWLAAG